ncbi:MAG: hypothetical protein PHF70_01415 [Opitutales bacterium]|nr:hypothetical protein [Opitutales bacterium]
MDKAFSPQKFLGELANELIFNFARASGGTTPGLVGSAREHEVRNKLQSVLPTKVAVSTGCVIDSFGNTSKQCDVILFEKDHCPVFSINGDPAATYIPCESVIAVGEIKSSVGTSDINDAVDKIARVKSLRRYHNNPTCFRQYGSVMSIQGSPSESFDPEHKPLDQIYGFILCHSFSLAAATIADRYATACSHHHEHLSPNLMVSLKDGLVLFTNEMRQVLENHVNAAHIFIGKTPDGEVPYLINKLATVANVGRTTEILPYARYLLKSGNTVFSAGTFFPAAPAKLGA